MEKQQCPCKNCRNFSRIAHFRHTELIIYRDVAARDKENIVNNNVLVTPMNCSEESDVPFHNINSSIIRISCTQSIDLHTKGCAECVFLMEKAKKYLCKIAYIDKDFVVGICSNCKKKDQIIQCCKLCEASRTIILFLRNCENDNITNKFKNPLISKTNLLTDVAHNNDEYFKNNLFLGKSNLAMNLSNINHSELDSAMAKSYDNKQQFTLPFINYQKNVGESSKFKIEMNVKKTVIEKKANNNSSLNRPKKGNNKSIKISKVDNIYKSSKDIKFYINGKKQQAYENSTLLSPGKRISKNKKVDISPKINDKVDGTQANKKSKFKRPENEFQNNEFLKLIMIGKNTQRKDKNKKLNVIGKAQKMGTNKSFKAIKLLEKHMSQTKTQKNKSQIPTPKMVDQFCKDCDICMMTEKLNQCQINGSGHSSDSSVSNVECSTKRDWTVSSSADIKKRRDIKEDTHKKIILKHKIISRHKFIKHRDENKENFTATANCKIFFSSESECRDPFSKGNNFTTSYSSDSSPKKQTKKNSKSTGKIQGQGIITYALSDKKFITNGWTVLPTVKILQKNCVFHAQPAQSKFDWFTRNKGKGAILYDTGEKFSVFDKDGHCYLYYRNGKLAVDQYYDSKGNYSDQRVIVYSNGEQDARGRTRPITVLAMFDYLGSGVVFDHGGKIRLKYNQCEGVEIDSPLGTYSTWRWHSFNNPKQVQRIFLEKQLFPKDPIITKLGQTKTSRLVPTDTNIDSDMLAVEMNNIVKDIQEKQKRNEKLSLKPFQIKMKALKINENFTLRILDQTIINLTFKVKERRIKMNLGIKLDLTKVIDEFIEDVAEVNLSRHACPPLLQSNEMATIQDIVEKARQYEQAYLEREVRIRPAI